MLLIQTTQAKRLRKFVIFTALLMIIVSGWGVVLTMHWHVLPPKK
ncbi:hypothetical protein SAMN05443247_00417 [Bradyrhizobium erythrophlei]|jgi:hypothetical protein|nr:hypothetical protein SAMN05443247_00417 [Bradyrhizobium erythrophlei]